MTIGAASFKGDNRCANGNEYMKGKDNLVHHHDVKDTHLLSLLAVCPKAKDEVLPTLDPLLKVG